MEEPGSGGERLGGGDGREQEPLERGGGTLGPGPSLINRREYI